MTFRLFTVSCLLLLLVSLFISFLWVQTVLPGALDLDPWGQQIHFLPTVFSLWLPGIFLFFSSIWLYLSPRLSVVSEKKFLKYDVYSYFSILIFFWLQIIQKELSSPMTAFKTLILGILVLKAFLLFRAFHYQSELIQPGMLFTLSSGLYVLSLPFLHVSPELELSALLQSTVILQIASIIVKALALSAMALETFRLSLAMTKSHNSAFFGWIAIAFSFPLLFFPTLKLILAGLLLIFILRLLISNVDTREFIRGLQEPTSLTIAVKLIIILMLLGAAGLIFWSNVKPKFGIQADRAWEAAIGSLLNGQYGLLSTSPIYWLALCGIFYFLSFKVWDGILLIGTGTVLYSIYLFSNYGMFANIPFQFDCVPFIPFAGVFIATAYHRFRKSILFRTLAGVLLFATQALNGILLLAFPESSTIPGKMSQWQHLLFTQSQRDISILLFSMPYALFSHAFFLTFSAVGFFTWGTCALRSPSFPRPILQKLRIQHGSCGGGQTTRVPTVLLLVLLLSAAFFHLAPRLHQLPLHSPHRLSRDRSQLIIPVDSGPGRSRKYRAMILVSTMRNSMMLPHRSPVANVTVSETAKQFEHFVIKAGRDSAEETLDAPDMASLVEHGRAAVFRTAIQHTAAGSPFKAHDYYSRFVFSKNRAVEQISLKLLKDSEPALPADTELWIKDIFLLE
ncbi:hypothetical protein CSB45_11725 [candidate division KSB3 bacterium]|uniref:Uncharacterized protein n=1 Tax=candidate division KSB3 bacterium TaxID=2044937 RepID=A0A2G6E2N2_9BACT|nr:MAG: hypothetical protein CSB45_11725 [candidate division KSB3 bacterium]PIE29276.1 MAG: hypothetical protein CSA57_09725 [candidate division KSB3 bacterium]